MVPLDLLRTNESLIIVTKETLEKCSGEIWIHTNVLDDDKPFVKMVVAGQVTRKPVDYRV